MDTKGNPDTAPGAPLAGPMRHPAPPSGDENEVEKLGRFSSPRLNFFVPPNKKIVGGTVKTMLLGVRLSGLWGYCY